MQKLVLCTSVALLLSGCANLPTPPDEGKWQTASPMQFARAAHAVVANEQAIFALAGTGAGGQPVLQVERFDGQQWTLETTLPDGGLNAPAAALLGNKIYLIGGFSTTSNVPVAKLWIYDLASKTWQAGANLPAARGGHSVAVAEGKIHVLGGGNERSTIANHSMYDPAQNTWQELTPLPRREGSPAVVAHQGQVYAIGGRSGQVDFGEVYIYDLANKGWNFGPVIEPRGTAGAVVYCQQIYLFGGESQAKQKSVDTVQYLDSKTNQWRNAPSMPSARNFARAVNFKNAVYVVGGSPQAGDSHESSGSNIVERFEKSCN